jgi:hypothetical protein
MALSGVSISPGGTDWSLAINIIIVGVLLSGIALGIGMALRSRKLWAWGVEELAQAIVNAALLGVLLAWLASVDGITSGMVDTSGMNCTALQSQMQLGSNTPLYYSRCALYNAEGGAISLISSLSSLSYKLGWLSGLTVSVNVVQAKPFLSFSDISTSYSQWAGHFALLLSASQVNQQFLSLVASSAFSLFLPAGLLLRMFFLTRKFGAALMAGSIGFFIVYPLAYSSLAQPQLVAKSIEAASASLADTYSFLSAVPIVDLGKSGDVANLISNLSGGQLPYASTAPYAALSAARASLELAFIFYPLIALALTAVAIRELYMALSAEFNLNLFEMV